MKRGYVTQTKFIQGADSWDTAEQFNEAMRELAFLNPTYERVGDAYWIYYKVEIAEEEETPYSEDLGRATTCADCPYALRDTNRYGNIDARKKWGTCGRTGERIHMESRSCDILADLMERRRK